MKMVGTLCPNHTILIKNEETYIFTLAA